MNGIAAQVEKIENEMQRIGFWSKAPSRQPDESVMYAGLSFEQWLQFVFLPATKTAVVSGDFSNVPRYKVGVASLRNYDYHSTIEEALPLMHMCFDLEKLLEPEISKA
jgi:uncharacterized protein YqcC (DUF446 family)